MDSYVPLGSVWYIYLSASFPVSWQISCNIQPQSSFGIFIVFTVHGVKPFNYYSVIDYPVLFCLKVRSSKNRQLSKKWYNSLGIHFRHFLYIFKRDSVFKTQQNCFQLLRIKKIWFIHIHWEPAAMKWQRKANSRSGQPWWIVFTYFPTGNLFWDLLLRQQASRIWLTEKLAYSY
jgi:hypothetical protein